MVNVSIIQKKEGNDIAKVLNNKIDIINVCNLIVGKTDICFSIADCYEFNSLERIHGFSGYIPEKIYTVEEYYKEIYIIPNVEVKVKKLQETFTEGEYLELTKGEGVLLYIEVDQEDYNCFYYYPPGWSGEEEYVDEIKLVKKGNNVVLYV